MIKNNIKKIIVVGMAAIVIIGGSLYFVGNKKTHDNKTDETYVRTVVLTKGSLDETVSTSGTVSSTDVSTISTNLTNPIKTVEVAVGDQVKEGDVIVTLDSTDIVNQINKAKETLQENINKAYETYQNAIAEKEKRYTEMKTAESNYNSKQSTYNSAKSNFDSAASTVNSYQSTYDSAKAAMEASGQALNAAQTAYVNSGGSVEETDCGDNQLCAAYKDAKEKYNAAKGAFDDAENALNDAKSRTNYDSYLAAYNSANEQYTAAKTAYEHAQQTFSTADANVLSTKSAYEKSQTSDELTTLNEQLENCTLKAKSSGTVTSLNATVGSKPSETIATIQDTSKLKVNITIEEYDMQKISEGMRCIITSDATDKEMSGILTQLSPVATTSTNGGSSNSASTFTGEVEITDPDENLLIGMNAKVQIVISSLENVYTVPLDAIEEKEDGTFVIYVKNEETNEFESVAVTKGEENDYYAQISGDQLKEGMIVRASAVESEAVESVSEGVEMMGNDVEFVPNEQMSERPAQGGGPRQ